MKVLGIVAEYNPFHRGHQFQIETAKRLAGAEAVVVLQSGNFTQRGEPALLEKHCRARMALAAPGIPGADLVLELPALYSAASAEYFAWGGISALHATGLVDTVSFGIEDTAVSLSVLQEAAKILSEEPPVFRDTLKNALQTGCSYPKARAMGLEAVTGRCADWLQQPNTILATEYMKANMRLGSPLELLPVQRQGAGYHTPELTDSLYPSATAIRQVVHTAAFSNASSTCNASKDACSVNSLDRLQPHMSAQAFSLLLQAYEKGDISDVNALFLPIVTLLRSQTANQLRQYPYLSEGLEYRCKQAAQTAATYEELLDACATVRYPRSRIRRIFLSLLAGITAADLAAAKENRPPYLRILAFNETGRSLLKKMKKTAALPVITKPAALHSLDIFAKRVAELESNATDVRGLTCRPPKPAGLDYAATPVYSANLHS